MKTKAKHSRRSAEEDLRKEYRYDYTRAKPNRFASRLKAGSVAVVLDPDVASVFRTSESVDELLRSVIAAIPEKSQAVCTDDIGTGPSALQRTDAEEKRGGRRRTRALDRTVTTM